VGKVKGGQFRRRDDYCPPFGFSGSGLIASHFYKEMMKLKRFLNRIGFMLMDRAESVSKRPAIYNNTDISTVNKF
jgi:hypothetical protein